MHVGPSAHTNRIRVRGFGCKLRRDIERRGHEEVARIDQFTLSVSSSLERPLHAVVRLPARPTHAASAWVFPIGLVVRHKRLDMVLSRYMQNGVQSNESMYTLCVKWDT
jgi:hypothetical protein